MNNIVRISRPERGNAAVVALHCSLGSGRQWKALADELARSHTVFAPDISGYGTNSCALDLPLTLAEEVRCLSGTLNDAEGPIHLVGHSYGGAIAFRIATASPFAHRIRSLTLIEPVLPTLLCEGDADRRLHARFAQVARDVTEDIWNGSVLEAIDMFTAFWNGSGPQDPVPASARLRMIERADKLVFDFQAAFAEENVAAAAASLRVPTLLLSGGLSPISPNASCSGSARSLTAPRSSICRPPATCCRSPMPRQSMPRLPDISPAPTKSPPFRWRWKQHWRRPSALRRFNVARVAAFLALGGAVGLLVSVGPKPGTKC